jgi:glycosyltransferase involved in cell wall biosynthesis
MKVGIFVIKAANSKGFERVASAHVQVPLKTISLLNEAGCDAQLITTEIYQGQTLPEWLPSETKVHFIMDSSKQGSDLAMHVGHKSGVHPVRFFRQLIGLIKLIKKEKFEVLHCFGSDNMAIVAGILKLLGLRIPIYVTCENGSFGPNISKVKKYLISKANKIFTCTLFMQKKIQASDISVHLLRHGVLRNILAEESNRIKSKERILFWRDPSVENGADTCLEVFKILAPLFPKISFDIAIRPHPDPVKGIDSIGSEIDNINVYTFPYPDGITLSGLINEAIFIFLPFKSLSVNPQFAVIESMLAEKTVITTDLDSNKELIKNGHSGFLVNSTAIEEMISICCDLIKDENKRIEIGKNAKEKILNEWNWNDYIPSLLSHYYRREETLTK